LASPELTPTFRDQVHDKAELAIMLGPSAIRSPRKRRRDLLRGAAFVALLLASAPAGATPGTHAPLVSTWDSTSSSVSGAFTSGFFGGGHLDFATYNSNFSSTSGNVSAQFGLHFVNYRPSTGGDSFNGSSGTAAFVYSAPVLGRWDSGLPKLGIGFYVGLAPTLLARGAPSGGPAIDGWIPLAGGVSMPSAPVEWLSLVPWVELSGGVSFDLGAAVVLPTMTNPMPSVGTTSNVTGAVDLRGGLKVDFHIGRRIDAGGSLMLANLGPGFTGTFVTFVGANINLHWDDVVPSVLPAKQRLETEKCEDILERMKECKASSPASSTSPSPEATPAPPPPKPPEPKPAEPKPAEPAPTPQDAPAPPAAPTPRT
jgi:hypothetical protein